MPERKYKDETENSSDGEVLNLTLIRRSYDKIGKAKQSIIAAIGQTQAEDGSREDGYLTWTTWTRDLEGR